MGEAADKRGIGGGKCWTGVGSERYLGPALHETSNEGRASIPVEANLFAYNLLLRRLDLYRNELQPQSLLALSLFSNL